MLQSRQIYIPRLVRIKPGALDRLGIYLQRKSCSRILLVASADLPQTITGRAQQSCLQAGVEVVQQVLVDGNSFESAIQLFSVFPAAAQAVVGLGGGKVLDIAKYLSFLTRRPYFTVPTSLSNDGFCSPQSSLTVEGKRRSLPAVLPHGVVVDVAVCLAAPKALWLSGVGDLVSKLTAVVDWKLAFHNTGEQVDDLAALLSDATVYQFFAAPHYDIRGMTLLATALMQNGIAMEICGSSRPASGSEHLVSHALDALSARPRLHGLQVGMATYIVSRLQGQASELIATLFTATGFWEAVRADPFILGEWLEAFRVAPQVKENYFTVLSLGIAQGRDCVAEAARVMQADPFLQGCFV